MLEKASGGISGALEGTFGSATSTLPTNPVAVPNPALGSNNNFWNGFSDYLKPRMSKDSAKADLAYAKQWGNILQTGDASALLSMKFHKRAEIMKALSNLSKYCGCYSRWQAIRTNYQLKWSNDTDGGIALFNRIVNDKSNLPAMIEWVKKAVNALPGKYGQVLIYDCLVGLRPSESCESIRLLQEQTHDYFNESDETLEHYKFPQQFIRRNKRAYVSVVNDEALRIAERADNSGYNGVFMAIKRRDMPVRLGYCRKIFATFMRSHNVPQESIDLYQGRIGKSVFARFYFRPDAAKERKRIRRLLPKLLNELN